MYSSEWRAYVQTLKLQILLTCFNLNLRFHDTFYLRYNVYYIKLSDTSISAITVASMC